MLDARRLQVLATFSVEGTMTATAAALFMTTSAVSQQLALLEREAGVALLVRSGRRVWLTEAGNVLVRHALDMAAMNETAETSMRRFRTDVKGDVRVSAFPSFSSAVLPSALRALATSFPELRVSIRDLEPLESLAELRAGRVDVAVVDDLDHAQLEGLEQVVLGEDELALLLPPAVREVLGNQPQLSELSDANWILDARGSSFEAFVRRLCNDAGFSPRVIANCGNLMVTMALVEAGMGVAVVTGLPLDQRWGEGEVHRLRPRRTRNVILLYRAASRDSPLVQAVISDLVVHASRFLNGRRPLLPLPI